MYDVAFYDKRSRRLLAGNARGCITDPTHPLAPAPLRDGHLAEARNVHDPRDVVHFDGKEWQDGPLPGAINQMHRN